MKRSPKTQTVSPKLYRLLIKLEEQLKLEFSSDYSYRISGCGLTIAASNLVDGKVFPVKHFSGID